MIPTITISMKMFEELKKRAEIISFYNDSFKKCPLCGYYSPFNGNQEFFCHKCVNTGIVDEDYKGLEE